METIPSRNDASHCDACTVSKLFPCRLRMSFSLSHSVSFPPSLPQLPVDIPCVNLTLCATPVPATTADSVVCWVVESLHPIATIKREFKRACTHCLSILGLLCVRRWLCRVPHCARATREREVPEGKWGDWRVYTTLTGGPFNSSLSSTTLLFWGGVGGERNYIHFGGQHK